MALIGPILQSKNVSLYPFTAHTFTNATATGVSGPTLAQCRTAYSATTWASNTAFFNMTTAGYQRWTVPKTGSYRLVCSGAYGGNGSGLGGPSITQTATFSLSAGDILSILIGQSGQSGTRQGGGGGGTFVFNVTTSTLLIASGGGGGGYNSTYLALYDTQGPATTSTSGKGGASGLGNALTNGGTGGGGGGNGVSAGYSPAAAGGGGYTGNGVSSGSVGGLSYTNGGTGGSQGGGNGWAGNGGFGGGGGGHGDFYFGGGGGGGYSGGGGGLYYGVGGGGGSFSSVTITSSATSYNTHGSLVVTAL